MIKRTRAFRACSPLTFLGRNPDSGSFEVSILALENWRYVEKGVDERGVGCLCVFRDGGEKDRY